MLAVLADALPANGSFIFEPKWDGFRAIVFRQGSNLQIQSRPGVIRTTVVLTGREFSCIRLNLKLRRTAL